MNSAKSTVHIHGSGYAPLLVAVSLHRAFPTLARAISVSLAPVEQPARALTSFSDMKAFNRQLKISEQSFLKACRASFHLAIRYSGSGDSRYFSESDFGAMWERIQFHQLYHIYRAEHQCTYDEFCLAAQLAKKNSFVRPTNQKGFPFSTLKYGYQFDDAVYYQALLTLAGALSIQVYQVPVKALNINAGQLQSITMNDGLQLQAELFIDCSATRDIAQQTHPAAEIIPAIPTWYRQDTYTPNRAQELPSASELQFDQTHKSIAKMTSLRDGRYQSVFRFSQGSNLSSAADRLPQSWFNNTLALGAASAQLPNLLIDQHYLLQRQLLRLIAMGALTDAGAGIKQLFNRACEQDLEQLVDIDNIHIAYLLADKRLLSSRNQQRVTLYKSSGSLYEIDNAILSSKQWVALLMTMGYEQQTADVEAQYLSPVRLNQKLTALRETIMRASEQSAGHEQWLEKAGGL